LTQEGAAHELRVAVSTYRSWESGTKTPRVGYRPRLAKLLDVSLAQVDAYLDDGNGAAAPNGHAVPAWLGHLASLEQGAAEIRTYEPVVINGLLQTVDYATAVERVGSDDEEAAKRVELRMARQDVLRRSPDPLRLWVVLDESTLLRPAGDNAVMADQLDHLVEMAALPNVTMQIMPLRPEVFLVAFGAFKLFVSPESSEPYMAFTEDGVGANYLDRPYDIERHVALFQSLADAALSPGESVDLVRTIAKERYQ
jgi:hypothetical protein